MLKILLAKYQPSFQMGLKVELLIWEVERCHSCGKRLAIAYVPNNNLGKIDFVPYLGLLHA